MALSKRLCFKCLNGGHFKDRCPKEAFKCHVRSCVEDHNTLLHPTPRDQTERVSSTSVTPRGSSLDAEDHLQQVNAATSNSGEVQRATQERQGASSVTVATGAGERRVCLGVLPVKVTAKGGTRTVETYALLDSGSEVTLCKEQLFNDLGSWGSRCNYELQGVTGSKNVEGHVVDIVVTSLDGSVRGTVER